MSTKEILLLLIGSGAVVYMLFWLWQGRQMQKSGHLPYRRPITALWAWKILTPILARVFIGPVRIIGGEKLKNIQNVNRVYAPNHTFPLDFDLVAVATRDNFFYMSKTSELKGARGIFGARTGAIPVNTKQPGGGQAAVDACVRALCRKCQNSVLVFPQGALKPMLPLVRSEFHNGAYRIALAAKQQTGEPVWVVPMGLYYVRDETCATETVKSKFVRKCRRAFGVTNYGAIVVVGDPIEVSALPVNEDAATDVLFAEIEKATKQAASLAEAARKTC